MKAKLTYPNGTIVELEGEADEIQKLMPPQPFSLYPQLPAPVAVPWSPLLPWNPQPNDSPLLPNGGITYTSARC